jgi:hypothetical protein
VHWAQLPQEAPQSFAQPSSMSTDCDGGNVLSPPQAHCTVCDWRQTGFSEPALSAQIVFRFAAHRCVAVKRMRPHATTHVS